MAVLAIATGGGKGLRSSGELCFTAPPLSMNPAVVGFTVSVLDPGRWVSKFLKGDAFEDVLGILCKEKKGMNELYSFLVCDGFSFPDR